MSVPEQPTTTPDAPDKPGPLREPRWLAWADTPRSVLTLVLVATTLRLVWLAFFSTLTLTEDEAHYWLWAQNLDWSYYSKGPGVAWLIAASTSIFGDTEFAVRLPAALAAALGALAAADACRSLSKGSRAHTGAFVAATLYLVAPALAVTGFLTTIDAPYLACWMLAVALTLRARANPRLWLLVGLTLAAGFLFKYTIALLGPGILWVIWSNRRDPQTSPVKARHLVALLLAASVGLVPVLLWNAQHDWATLRHLLGHLGAPGGDTGPNAPAAITERALWPLEYLGFLLFIAGPIPMILLVTLLFRRFPLPERTADAVRLALPLAAFYLIVSFINRTEGNWAIAAPATLIPAAAWAIVHGVRHNIWPVRFLWGATLFTGFFTWLAFFSLTAIATIPALHAIPARRLTGLRDHATAVQAEIERLRASTGIEPFVISTHYGRASQLSFYLPGHPTVYCTSARTGGRKTQFELWPHTNLDHPETHRQLVARPAIALGGDAQHWLPAFEALQPLGPLYAEPKARRSAYLAYGYRGFDTWTPWQHRVGWTSPNSPPATPPTTTPANQFDNKPSTLLAPTDPVVPPATINPAADQTPIP